VNGHLDPRTDVLTPCLNRWGVFIDKNNGKQGGRDGGTENPRRPPNIVGVSCIYSGPISSIPRLWSIVVNLPRGH
jgi:hypothetical protein